MGEPDFLHFIDAQERVFEQALGELRAGKKRSHWMWFVFPQIAGLGASAMSQRFAIASLDEARAYLAHPILGARLRAATAAVLGHAEANTPGEQVIRNIFGAPDDLKFHSSMTLFHRADPSACEFNDALGAFFGGAEDSHTVARL